LYEQIRERDRLFHMSRNNPTNVRTKCEYQAYRSYLNKEITELRINILRRNLQIALVQK
jgi:hypothetical protein